MTPQEVQERLKLNQLKDKIWYVVPSCATTGEGLFEGLVRFTFLFISIYFIVSRYSINQNARVREREKFFTKVERISRAGYRIISRHHRSDRPDRLGLIVTNYLPPTYHLPTTYLTYLTLLFDELATSSICVYNTLLFVFLFRIPHIRSIDRSHDCSMPTFLMCGWPALFGI